MSERVKSFSNTINFVRAAYDENFLGAVPPLIAMPINPENPFDPLFRPSKATPKKQRLQNAALLYIFADVNDPHQPYQTLEEIGALYGYPTRELIRQDVKQYIENLHQNSQPHTQKAHPLSSFSYARPLTLSSRYRKSEASGGLSSVIAKRLDTQSFEDIKRDYTPDQIANVRHVLEGWGVLEWKTRFIVPRFEALAKQDASDDDIQAKLNEIADTNQVDVLKKAGIVVDHTTLAGKAGIYLAPIKVHLITASLKANQIPYVLVPHKFKDADGNILEFAQHRISAAVHEARAVEALENDHSLDNLRTNPVTQVAGPKVESLPNTWDLVKRGETIGVIIEEIRGMRWKGRARGGFKTLDIIKDSPVPIYNVCKTNPQKKPQNNFKFDKTNEDALRPFLEHRMQELGII